MTFDPINNFETLREEFNNLETISKTSNDPYFLALYSAALYNVEKPSEAVTISKRIVPMQNEETGAVEGAKSSITSSRG